MKLERERVVAKANTYLSAQPITVTAQKAEHSAGSLHDFYLEGDCWWPDPNNPSGPYIRRDGETNPNNFLAHRKAMICLSEITASYVLTHEEQYANAAVTHFNAWFIDPVTKTNPSLA